MLMRKLYGLCAALCATIILLATDAPSAPSPTAFDTLPAHQLVTFRPATHLKLEEQSLEQIVTTMRKKESLPLDASILIHHNQYRAQQGVQVTKNDSTVFIFARGFEPRPCAAYAARLYEHHIIPPNCPLIGFDFNDRYRNFSFGQDTDVAFLKQIYEQVLQQNPAAKIVLIGNCNGAKVAMDFATQKPKQLHALILLTPFISPRPLFRRMTQYYALGIPFSADIARVFFSSFTAYDPKKDNLIERLGQIDKRVPIFIGQRMYDAVVPDEEVEKLAQIFQQQGNPFDGIIVYDPSKAHNNLIYNETIQYRINRFLKQYNLPYNKKSLYNTPANTE